VAESPDGDAGGVGITDSAEVAVDVVTVGDMVNVDGGVGVAWGVQAFDMIANTRNIEATADLLFMLSPAEMLDRSDHPVM
jgi:hypothetical protein